MNHNKLRQLKQNQANNEVLVKSLLASNGGRAIELMRELVVFMRPSDGGWRKVTATCMRKMTDDDLATLGMLALHAVNNVMQAAIEESVPARN